MKKLVLSLGLILAGVSVIVGCKVIPTEDVLYTTSYSIGTSAALVMNSTSISEKDRAIIINIANIVDESVPQTNVTFEVAWTPIATEHVNELVNVGSIDETEGQIILSLFKTATKTLDYIVYKRYPTVGQNIELVSAVTHGFISGFLTSYSVSTTTFKSNAVEVIYDKEAYDYMMQRIKK